MHSVLSSKSGVTGQTHICYAFGFVLEIGCDRAGGGTAPVAAHGHGMGTLATALAAGGRQVGAHFFSFFLFCGKIFAACHFAAHGKLSGSADELSYDSAAYRVPRKTHSKVPDKRHTTKFWCQ